MRAIEWRRTAREDLFAIIDYISDDNPDAAQRLKDEIQTRVAKLPVRFNAYRPGRLPGTREMVVHPNYIIVYSVDEFAVTILRVLHAARQWPSP